MYCVNNFLFLGLEEGSLTCTTCNKVYKNSQSFKRHLKYQCTGELQGQFQCYLCGHKCNYKNNLKSHFIHRHKMLPDAALLCYKKKV